jgi:nucleoside-diphosphate-sugar epimerase
MQKSNNVLVVGCGRIGVELARLLQPQGFDATGICRRPQELPPDIRGLPGDYVEPGSLDGLAALAPDFVVATLQPVNRSLAGYRAGFVAGAENLLRGLGSHRPRHLFMVSSTRVFAEADGGWVDEQSPLDREDRMAGAIIEAEQLFASSGLDCSRVRFAGIYGDPAGSLLRRVAGGEICAAQPVRYSNRIHRRDCAGFLAHLICAVARDEPLEAVYIGVDDEPASRHEVESWLAAELGISEPREVAVSERPGGHRRCRNRALHASGYQLLYPDYRSGYRALLAQRRGGG